MHVQAPYRPGRTRDPRPDAQPRSRRASDHRPNPIRSAKLSPSRPSTSTPRRAAIGLPEVAERPPGPDLVRTARAARRPAAAFAPGSGRSDGVVGSHPWSPGDEQDPAVRAPRSAPGAAGRTPRSRFAYPAGSLRCPYFESKSTRFVKTNAGCGPPQVVERQVHAVVVRVRVAPLGDPLAGEDVPDLADAVHGHAGRLEAVEHRRARAAARRSPAAPGAARTRPAAPRTAGRSPCPTACWPVRSRRATRHHS